MGWRHPADDLAAARAHQPRTLFLPATATATATAAVPEDPGLEPVGDGRAAGEVTEPAEPRESGVRRRDSAAVRAGCSCGWRGPRLAITQQGGEHSGPGPAEVDREVETLQRRRLQGQWEAHLRAAVPTLDLHLHMPHVRYLDTELAAAVAHARRHDATWAEIAAACSRPATDHRAGVVMSRQGAQQRWGQTIDRLDVPGQRASLPVVTGWPGHGGWTHPAAGLDPGAAHDHQPGTVWVQRSGGESQRRTRASTALRPGCGCGWRGSPRPLPDEPPSRMPKAVAGIERGFGPEWGRHLYTAVATLCMREVLDLMDGVHADLDDAVAHARAGHASWQDIADVVGTRRQSAHQRWRHLDHPREQHLEHPRGRDGPDRGGPEAVNTPAGNPSDSPTHTGAGGPARPRARVRKAPPLLRPARR